MKDLVPLVVAEVDRHRDRLVDLCRELVRINTVNPYAGGSTTGSEAPGQRFLEPLLRGMGGRTRMFEPPPDVYARLGVLGPKGRSWTGRPNLVTEFVFGPGPRIVLNSHMDTVGVDDMRIDPFAAELRDGRILGRGASDDKGGLAMGIVAIQALLPFADALRGSIVHQSVVDEECSGGGAGTLACCLEQCLGDEAIVIDGGGLAPVRGCGGCLTADVHVTGQAGHAARGGVNAIDKAIAVKAGIDAFRRARELADPDCRVNLGVFCGGTHPAVVPSAARMSLNIVYRAAEAAANEAAGRGWNGASVRELFECEILRSADGDAWLQAHPPQVEWIKDLVPFELPADAPLVQRLRQAHADALQRPAPVPEIMSAWADAANLVRYGGVPSVLYGPGTPGAAHAADESVAVQDLVDGAKTVAAYMCRRLSTE